MDSCIAMTTTPQTLSAAVASTPETSQAPAQQVLGAQAQAQATPEDPSRPVTPPALLKLMVTDWEPASSKLPPPIKAHETFFSRRRALSKLFPAETIIIPTGHEQVRSNDTHYPFRPSSDFYYLTGNSEPDCVLVMQPVEGGGHRDILFVEPNPGRSDVTFFTDRAKGELWVGPRLGVEQSRARFGVHECRALPDLPAFIGSLNDGATRPWRMLRSHAGKVGAMLPEQERDKQLATALSEMRLLKDELEVKELKAVVAATKRGFEDVIYALKRARSEREVEATFNKRARVEGNSVGYGTIAACSEHACILHWTRNDGKLKKRSLLLLDAGVEGNSLYTADITRTLPIRGKFSKEQRRIYELVLAAQSAAFKEVKPGNDFMDPNRAAMRVLAEGLVKLGILKTTAEEALKEEHQFYKRYTLHNVSHMLGLDVHDCAQARQESYKLGKLKPGMVLTVEPGLYFQTNDLTVPEKYRGIGVRIEDDVLVTEDGMKNLSADIPRETDEVEAWMAKIWKGKRRG
jgi:Xaa-Pro aminopeptidase